MMFITTPSSYGVFKNEPGNPLDCLGTTVRVQSTVHVTTGMVEANY